MMGKLACMLPRPRLSGTRTHTLFRDIAMAILTRAMENGSQLDDKPRQALPPWWLERTIAYMESRLGEQVTLSDIADLAGLSRMHFASQFKRLTGLSPSHIPHCHATGNRQGPAWRKIVCPSLKSRYLSASIRKRSFTAVFRKVTGDDAAAMATERRFRCPSRSTVTSQSVPSTDVRFAHDVRTTLVDVRGRSSFLKFMPHAARGIERPTAFVCENMRGAALSNADQSPQRDVRNE